MLRKDLWGKVEDNLRKGLPSGHGLLFKGEPSIMVSLSAWIMAMDRGISHIDYELAPASTKREVEIPHGFSPEIGEVMHYITTNCGIFTSYETIYEDLVYDNQIVMKGMAFRTESEAQSVCDQLNSLFKVGE